MKKRLFALLLCLALAVGALAGSALAAPAVSSHVKIEIAKPYAGETPDFSPAVSANCALVTDYPATGYIGGVRWRDATTDRYLGQDDPFIEGHEYTLRLALEAVNSTFRNDGTDVDVTFSLNGGESKAAGNLTAAGYDDPSRYLSISYTFPAVEQKPKRITWLNEAYVKLTEPVVGQTPDLSPVAVMKDFAMAAPGYTVKSVQWMEKNPNTGLFENMAADAKFQANTEYAAQVIVTANKAEGYRFSSPVSGWINSADDKGAATLLSGDDGQCVFYKSWKSADTILTYGTITIEAPVAGEKPSYQPQFSEGLTEKGMLFTNTLVNGVEWSTEKGPIEWNSAVFEEGVSYTVTIYLATKNGYLFHRETSGDKLLNWIHLTLNGIDVWYDTVVDPNRWSSVVTYTFPPTPAAGPNVIQSVALAYDAPTAGAHPDFSFEILAGEILPVTETKDPELLKMFKELEEQGLVMVNGVVWMDYEAEKYLKPDDVFEEGRSYYAMALFVARDGFKFSSKPAATVNGAPAADVDVGPQTLNVSFFAEAGPAKQGKKLESIAVTAPPARTEYTAGQAFDPEGMVVTATYSDKTTAAVTGYTVTPQTLAQSDTYVTVSYTEGDVTRTATTPVTVKAPKTLAGIAVTTPPTKTQYNAGQSFDPAGMVVTATYSDQSTAAVTGYTVSPQTLSQNDTYVTISYTEGEITKTATTPVTVKPAKTLTAIAVTVAPAKTEYTAGEAFDPTGMVVTATYSDQTTDSVAGYTVTPTALTVNNTYVTVSYTEGGVTKTATVAVTVKANEKKNPFKDIFETDYYYDAVLWAYYAEPQVTNGMSADEFGPKNTVTRGQAVTFLWRAMGRPEPVSKTNPFEDVSETEYYYKAVLWAVEKGITNGTDATHFTPNQTCSTAHILTFLYRTLGVGSNGWYEAAGAWAQGAGLLDGLNTAVSPEVNCPRADVVLFLHRAVGK